MQQDQLIITGKFLGAGNTKTVGNNGYTVRSFWVDITTNPEYPNTPEFQLKGDKVNLVDNLQKGQTVTVKFNLDGRKYDKTAEGGKKGVITNMNAWRIDVVQTQSAATIGNTRRPAEYGQPVAAPAGPRPAPAPAMAGPGQYAPAGNGEFTHVNDGSENDLPF